MRKAASDDGLTVNAIAGTHVVALGFNLSDARRAGCLGFSIQREDHTEQEVTWLRGMKTFQATGRDLALGGTVPSREHPFQAFQWADYAAKPEHDYTYTVIPYYGTPNKREERGRVSVRVQTEPELGRPHSVFFNRGAVASQEYAREFHNTRPDKLPPGESRAAYAWLSRGLLEALLEFLQRAKGPGFALYGAIYEFQWPEVLDELRRRSEAGATVEIVYDGIVGRQPTMKNAAAVDLAKIGALCAARTTGRLMHNKFFVLARNGTPIAVWTGSTNISENGIFGHLNCGHIVESKPIAKAFLDYWTELGAQPSPASAAEKAWMKDNNPAPPDPWSSDLVAIFSPRDGPEVLDWYRAVAAGARRALFMTFAFGMDQRFQTLYDTDDTILRIALMDKEGSGKGLKKARETIKRIRARPNVLVAVGRQIKVNSFDRWLAERSGLTQGVQWVHTKFMLVDPLSTAPVVITGSANFSDESIEDNNENMLVIRGDTRVADIYLGEFLRTYSHYAFREAVSIAAEKHEDFQPQHLATTDAWQREYYEPGNDRDLRRRYFSGA